MKHGRFKHEPVCPRCKKMLDGWTSPEQEIPSKGDVTVCAYCKAVLTFTSEMKLELASAETVMEVTLELSRIQNAIKKF